MVFQTPHYGTVIMKTASVLAVGVPPHYHLTFRERFCLMLPTSSWFLQQVDEAGTVRFEQPKRTLAAADLLTGWHPALRLCF
ncbi:hypothetical protein BD408DRAFT_420304 [Parasitella parasitica]|nr:hypothetical protein BD408DRAFT_420304 [Parasitella parasitica]